MKRKNAITEPRLRKIHGDTKAAVHRLRREGGEASDTRLTSKPVAPAYNHRLNLKTVQVNACHFIICYAHSPSV